MDAGRELDRLVAERVFGYVVTDGYGDDADPWKPAAATIGAGTWYEHRPDSGGWRVALPRYSTDLAAAWQVIDHLIARDYAVTLSGTGGGWAVTMVAGADGIRVGGAAGPHAAHGICLAALRAVGALAGGGHAEA